MLVDINTITPEQIREFKRKKFYREAYLRFQSFTEEECENYYLHNAFYPPGTEKNPLFVGKDKFHCPTEKLMHRFFEEIVKDIRKEESQLKQGDKEPGRKFNLE